MEQFKGTEDELTDGILKVFYQVYNELGHGFLEAVYARAMGVALEQAGFAVASEVMIPVSISRHSRRFLPGRLDCERQGAVGV